MKDQLKIIREALLLRDMESCEEALAVLDQIEAMVVAWKPGAWIERNGELVWSKREAAPVAQQQKDKT